ncbi:MAG: TonB-dependent receptor domain-containing protein [Bacteroidales bacterium]
MKHLLFTFIFILIQVFVMAQTGTIRGTVYEERTGESLVGVTIAVQGTTKGTMTDLDGQFSLDLEPGTYNLKVSYISFQTIVIEDVKVTSDEVTLINEVFLQESSLDLQEVVVSAQAIRTTEIAMMTSKKKSATIMDGISSARMSLVGDATAVEAAKRVTGVSIEDGKYVYIRGLGDRYSKTTLNQVDVPGLDPDKNTIQMDVFPNSLIDNITVLKNLTAELPADFTGGLLNIETKDFPDEKIMSFSFSTAYNPEVHFNSDFLSYEGGKTDFLGFDDGTRALPSRAQYGDIPTPVSGASEEEVSRFVQSFNPNLAAAPQTSLMDISASFSIGNQIDLRKKDTNSNSQPKLGYILSLSYKNDYTFYDDVTYSDYQRYVDPDVYDLRYATIQKGQIGKNNVLVGAIGGVAYKTRFSKIRLTATHLQNGESKAGRFLNDNDGAAVGQSGYIAGSDNLEYNQRSLSNIFLNGSHLFDHSGWNIDWRISPTYSTSFDPDIRKTSFTYRTLDTLFLAGAGGNPSRIWRSLSELNATAKVDFTKQYNLLNNEAKLRFGANHTFKKRDYEILFFDIQFFGGQSWSSSDPSQVLLPENIYPNRPNSIYYQSGNNNPNPNEYSSNIHNTAFYISNEFNLTDKLKSITGIRLENFVARHTGRDQAWASGNSNGRNLDNDKVLESFDFFPSVNLIYSLTEDQNLRASYSGTIARPTFKELSFAQIIDPITNRIFNGSLLPSGSWTGDITETRIDNFDLRWELFLEEGQLISLSAFYKMFDSPLELVRIPEQQTSTEYQVRNVGDAELMGVELEFRKDLDFISSSLEKFRLSGNLTWVWSSVEMSDSELSARSTYAKKGQTIESRREMAGQAPYVINAGVLYNDPDNGIDAGLFYNLKGPTLTLVGSGLYPDVYEDPFHGLNASFRKKIGKNQNTTLDLKVSNILADTRENYFSSFKAEQRPYSLENPGRTFSLGISYSF